MANKTFILLSLLFCSLELGSLSANTITISTDSSPYAGGILPLYVNVALPQYIDTIRFSGWSCRILYQVGPGVPEAIPTYWGIAFDTANISKLGVSFLIDSSISPRQSLDTVWQNSIQFPSGLRYLGGGISFPNVWKRDSLFTLSYLDCGFDYDMICNYFLDVAPNAKAIVYVQSKNGRHYKLQLKQMTTQTDSTVCGPSLSHQEPDSLYLQWAVDSLDNGLFRLQQNAVRNRADFHKCLKSDGFYRVAIASARPGPSADGPCYSILGRMIRQVKSNRILITR